MKYFLLFLFVLPFSLFSQTDTSNRRSQLELLNKQLEADSAFIYRARRIRPYLHYHERHSLNNLFTTNFYGPEIGIALYEKHIVGVGFYFSGKATRQPFETFDNNLKVRQNINVNFISVFYKYILTNHRYYEIHFPLELGSGTYFANYRDSTGFSYKTINDPLLIASASVFCILKPLRWIGVSGSIGYRVTNKEYFTGMFYTLGVWVGIRNLQSDFRYHIIKKKRYRKDVKALYSGH